MLPFLYLILIRRNGSPYPEVTVVNLPSSLMIVSSNAFVYSTSLLGVVSRYGYIMFTVFPEHSVTLQQRLLLCKQDFLIVLSFRLVNLEAVTLIKYHKLKARVNSLFRYSYQHYHLSYLIFNLKKIKSKIYPTFRYPIYIYIYGQNVGILFRSVKFSMLLSI